AVAVGDAEAGAVGRALKAPAVRGKEAVGRPIERRAPRRAAIAIGDEPAAPPHHHDLERAVTCGGGQAARHAVAKVGERAERAAARRTHGAVPPILQISFHAAGSTGITDRREWRTSSMSASFGSALIATRSTGLTNGRSGATSTWPKRPLSSLGS